MLLWTWVYTTPSFKICLNPWLESVTTNFCWRFSVIPTFHEIGNVRIAVSIADISSQYLKTDKSILEWVKREYLGIFTLNLIYNLVFPWLVWLSGLSTSLWTEGLLVWFPVRAHAWVAGQVPSGGAWEATTHWHFSPSLSPSLPPCKNK